MTSTEIPIDTPDFFDRLNEANDRGPVLIVLPSEHTPEQMSLARSARRNRYDVDVVVR